MRRRSIRERRQLVTGLLVTLAVGLSLATAPLVLAAPRLVISPSNGIRGATLKATANDFPAGTVYFTWDGSIGLGTATSDGQKAILNFQIPSGASTGDHTVRACAASPCTGSDPQDEAQVTVSGGPTPPPTPQPTPPPTPQPTPGATGTPSPTPRITPRPTATPRPTPTPTPRPPGVTAEPSVAPTTSPGLTSPGPSPKVPPSPAPSPAAEPTPDVTPAASTDGIVVVPTPARGEPTSSPGPLTAAPASETDPFVGRLFLPIGLIVGLVIAGFLLARVRGRAPGEALGGAAEGAGSGIEPEPYSAAGIEDPWAHVRTISVHVEQIEPPEE